MRQMPPAHPFDDDKLKEECGIFGIIGWTHRWFRPDGCETSAEEIGQTYADVILSGLEMPY